MNQELKNEILKLCREQYVAELCKSYHYEIHKEPLSIRMQVSPDGDGRIYTLTVTNHVKKIYEHKTRISNGFIGLALSPDQYDLKEISEAMMRNVREQQRAVGHSSKTEAAREAAALIRSVFNNEKGK